MGTVYCRLTYSIRGVLLPEDVSHSFSLPSENNIEVVLRAPTEDERTRTKKADAFCTAIGRWNASDKNQTVFEEIRGILSPQSTLRATETQTDPELQMKGEDVLLLGKYPQHFQELMRQVHRQLSHSARKVLGLFRWTLGELGPHNPISSHGIMWSWDMNEWHTAPLDIFARAEMNNQIRNSAAVAELIQAHLTSTNGAEPLGHDLFREAWELRHSKLRSSLVIGVAALEVGIKHFIGELVPNARWLALNSPSPSITRLLKEYLPTLPGKCRDGRISPPPPAILKTITDAVTLRNATSHSDAATLTTQKLEEILLAVRDTLWLLDFHQGHEWALRYIGEDTRNALGI